MAKFTCPYCINTYKASEVEFVCPDCASVAVPSFLTRRNGKVTCKTTGCGRLATRRVCPKCAHDIPSDALDTPNLPFSIVGVTNSGKTNYITVMLHELARASKLRLALTAQDRDTRLHQADNKRMIYDLHRRPPNTAAGESMPQIWRIKNIAKQGRHSVPTYTFTIFDGAGEDHENMEPHSVVCRYIALSKAIILTLDPLILESIKRSNIVDPAVRNNSLAGSAGGAASAELVINNVAEYIKTASHVKPSEKLAVPVAVVLTKFDTVIHHPAFPANALIKQDSVCLSIGKIDHKEFKQIDSEIRTWLYEIEEGSLINALDAHFQQFQFFGVSSFGEAPRDMNALNPIHPHRVLDPILWLFHRHGFID